ncbi:MAG: hypothetical protein B6242_17135 [Anaerolineaceae bacterium 4572_78]|nr:MAG: hypothetical protein B6242_17135 [Anaerolineaceae bacterium 4572_78]
MAARYVPIAVLVQQVGYLVSPLKELTILILNPTNFGDMIDFFHGHDDLEKGIIRVLHEHSFKDDPTRIFRAVRFESRFDFQIEPDTLGYLDNALEIISYLTSKRIWAELKRILNESMPDKALKRLGDLGIFTAIYPNLQMDDTLLNQCRMLRDGCEELHWSKIKPSNIHYVGLFTFPMGYEQMRELVLRLKLPNNVRRILQHVQAIKIIVPKLKMPQSDSQLYALLSPYNDSALFICWLAIEDTTVRQKLIHFSKNLRHVRPLINGTYLVENMGLSPSPIFSKILTMLRNARLDKKVSTLTDEHDCVVMFITNKAKGLYDESTNTY